MKPKGSRASSGKSAYSLLEHAPDAQRVMAHASTILKISRAYQQLVPFALANISQVANFKAGVVIIHTEHGSAANKLKQQTNRLIDEFLKKGIECIGIEVRVQAKAFHETETTTTHKPLSEQALTHMTEAADKMRDGSPLKAKIAYLIEHAAR